MDLSPISPARPPVALLCDGENLSPRMAPAILAAARRLGDPILRRVYGKAEYVAAWADHGFRLCPTRPGKNAADLLLSVEAMDLALRQGWQHLVIVSSDSDFSYLAGYLREAGRDVTGLGEAKTPRAFREACSTFLTLPEPAAPAAPAPAPAPVAIKALPVTKLIPLVRKVLREASTEGGWCSAWWIERRLKAADPDFTVRQFGEGNLQNLLLGLKFFEMEPRDDAVIRLRDPHRPAPVPGEKAATSVATAGQAANGG